MPTNFSYLIDHRLAGMARPAEGEFLFQDLRYLKQQGIGAIVSLTMTPLECSIVRKEGFKYLHLPIPDFTAPQLDQIRAFIRFYECAQAENTPLVVHCGAGQGRTGTMLACVLVRRGMKAAEAIREVRRCRPCSIETPEQEQMIETYENVVRKEANGTQSA